MLKKLIIPLILLAVALSVYFFYNSRSRQDQKKQEPKRAPAMMLITDIQESQTMVRQNDSGYQPAEITVKKKSEVAFVNDTAVYVWPASNLHPTHDIYPEFDPQEPIPPGKAWVFTFDRIGEWQYHDHLKPNRRGKIKVIE